MAAHRDHEEPPAASGRRSLNPAFAAHLREAMTGDGKVDYDRLLALINVAYDRADQDRAELAGRIEALQADLGEEQRFREMAGSGSDWFWETDEQHRLLYVSERIGLSLGIKPAALIGLSYFDLGLDEHDPALAVRHRQDVAEHLPFRDVQFHIGPATGSDARTIRISGVPVFREDETFSGYRGVGVDVTREATAERSAKVAQQWLGDALDCIGDSIALFDSEDRLVFSNKHFRSFLERVEISPAGSATYSEILDALRVKFRQAGVDLGPFTEAMLRHHLDATGEFHQLLGPVGWVLARDYRMSDGGIVAVRTDIDKMVRREQETEALRHRYALILDCAGDGILGVDGKGEIIFANRMARSILGYEAEGLDGRSIHSLAGPEAPFTPSLDEADGSTSRDTLFLRRDGSKAEIEYLLAPIGEAGEPAGAVMVFRDVALRREYEKVIATHSRELERQVVERTTELRRENEVRIRTEAALRASRERFIGIADSLFEGVVVVNRPGDIVFVNASLRKQLDLGEEELEGLPLDNILKLVLDEEPLPYARSPWVELWSGREPRRDDDAVIVTASGKSLSVAYAAAPILEEGNFRNLVISFRDITILKQAQWEALQASRLASVGQLAAGIAHEINTPVQYVGNNLRFIGDSLEKMAAFIRAPAAAPELKNDIDFLIEELPAAVAESLDGVEQISRIVLSMKEFSHPGSSAKTMTDINHALETTLTVTSNVWRHAAEIVRTFDADLPPVPCHVGELNQVFLNLIVNAAQAIEMSGKPLPGTITISTRVAGQAVEIAVADSGTGIPPAIREKIFDPFFTTKEVGKGTGQGLAICRDVVMVKHGGSLTVESEEGVGATFLVRLPLSSDAASPP